MSKLTSDITTRLEGADTFDAELWREVAYFFLNKGLINNIRLVQLLAIISDAEKAPSLANHLMLAVAAALVPGNYRYTVNSEEVDPAGDVLKPTAIVVRFGADYSWLFDSVSASIPANALASASIKAREQIGRE